MLNSRTLIVGPSVGLTIADCPIAHWQRTLTNSPTISSQSAIDNKLLPAHRIPGTCVA